MPMRSGKQRGFSFVEPAIALAILGILAALVIPAYQDTFIQKDVNSGLRLVKNLQGAMDSYHRRTHLWPSAADLMALGAFPTTISPVRSIVIRQSGVIEIEFDGKEVASELRMKTLEVTPYSNAQGDVLWQCGGPWTLNTVICGQRIPLDTTM
jgi:prepilin-type N-terminal cleavage/methylation domain-containing protein